MTKTRLLSDTILATAMGLGLLLTTPATAQTVTDAPPAAADPAADQTQPAPAREEQAAADQAAGGEVVVTGSVLRRADTETASPVTVLTAADLDRRGVNTVQEALQTLSANNGGTLMNSFTANGAFAGGASAASLRGLTTSSTLVLFDGLRAAYYPLADDGSRNFVDMNTIPDAIVERVEVLKDGASSTYGADAVAGVINIITRKQIQGLSARVEAGITERGDSGNQRLEATWGIGRLEEQGFNAYVSAHYLHQDALYNRDRGFPYNTANLSSRCLPGGTLSQCQTNGVFNGVQADGTFLGISSATLINYARPANPITGAPVAGSRYQQLTNPAAGCGALTAFTLTGAQLTNTGGNAGATAPANGVVCQEDPVARYNVISPQIERLGGSARATVRLSDAAEAYAIVNFEQSRVQNTGVLGIYRTTSIPGPLLQRYTTASSPATQGAGGLFGQLITLPVYVCPRGTTVACTATNGALNPNNPFAAQGQRAAIIGRLSDIQQSSEFLTRAYRGALGISGTVGGDAGWRYSVEATGMRVDLRTVQRGRVFAQHLLDVVNDGSYNWINPERNSQAVRDYLAPVNINNSYSELYQAQAVVSGTVLTLPGGPLQAAVGVAFRDERVNAPSANPGVLNQPTQQYFGVNGFSSRGHRNVRSAYFEIGAPIFDQLELSASGRYDDYSSGEHNFSPKLGAKFSPIRALTFRGTYSRGFRIASFAETGSSPTTGFVSANAGPTCLAQNPVANTLYCNGYALGLSQQGAAGLKPEKSRNFTGGVIFEPVRWLTFTADYYNIRKTDVITGANFTPALAAYYAGQPIPAGFQVIPDVPSLPDVAVNPNAQPRAAFVIYLYINGPRQDTSGVDLSATARVSLGSVKLISSFDATYIINYDQTFPGGGTQRYAGTLGNFQITSGSGTPRWRGSMQNTLDFGGASLTATAYYSDGYNVSAEDQTGPGTAFDCTSGFPATYRDGTPIQCDVKHFISVDLSGSVDVSERFSIYLNVLNFLDAKPPLDATTYGGYQYNPAWANAGIIGRAFRAGAKVRF